MVLDVLGTWYNVGPPRYILLAYEPIDYGTHQVSNQVSCRLVPELVGLPIKPATEKGMRLGCHPFTFSWVCPKAGCPCWHNGGSFRKFNNVGAIICWQIGDAMSTKWLVAFFSHLSQKTTQLYVWQLKFAGLDRSLGVAPTAIFHTCFATTFLVQHTRNKPT